MAGIFEFARFLWIEFRLGSANLTNKNVEVGRTFLVPDESGKREFLYRHRVPPCGKHSKSALPRPDFYGVLMRPSKSISSRPVRQDAPQPAAGLQLLPPADRSHALSSEGK